MSIQTDKYPVTIEDLQKTASEDLKTIDKTRLDDEAARVSELIVKYLKIYNRDKLLAVKHQSDLNKKRMELWLYYSGKADPAVYKENPFSLKVLKGDINMFIEGNDDYIKLNAKKEMMMTRLDFIEGVLKTLHNRGFAVKNILDFIKFTNGAY